MNNAVKISLISKQYTLDNIGRPAASEKKLERFAIMSSINQSEFYQSGLQGLVPFACYTVRLTEYNGEDEIEIGSGAEAERLTIYRTYNRTDGRVELYTTKRKGSR